MISLVKTSLKLLLRNKGFLFFLIATPILSTIILNLRVDQPMMGENGERAAIYELKSCNQKAVYKGDTSACIIKVYDGSMSKESDYVLQQLAKMGMYSLCRADVCNMSEQEVAVQAKKDAFDDRAAMLLYLKRDFSDALLSGNYKEGMLLYDVSEDGRRELFQNDLKKIMSAMTQMSRQTNGDMAMAIQALTEAEEYMPEKEIVMLAGKESVQLTEPQKDQLSQIGYAFAFITLGFLFCGVCVAHSVIEEKNNKVYTRMMLTKINGKTYFLSKFVVAFCISIIQTLVLAICLALMPGLDVGMGFASFLLIIFLQGLIFCSLSLLVGVLLLDVMSSNYAMFAIWSISALLSGLYFPLDDTTKALKTISYLMPQRWFMDASKLLLAGDNSAYSMVLCVTVAFLIVIISVGGVGLKMKKEG